MINILCYADDPPHTYQRLQTSQSAGFLALIMVYLLVFIHLEDTISFSPSRYVKSLLPSPLSVPSPFDGRNERHYPRKISQPAT